jgi:radical SAM superfamily enzyme YgiQ (UPF0313 family)
VYPYRRDLKDVGFFPPLGLEHIAAVIEPHAQSLDVVDMRKEAGRTKDFLRPETDMVCFSVNWSSDAEFVREEILSVGSKNLVVVGGRHATEDPQAWLSQCPNVTAVARGDGEEIMGDICRDLPIETIAGLSFRRDGRIFHNPNRKPGPVSDDLYPNRSLRRYEYEVSVADANMGVTIDTLSSSRGCPFNCTFCSFSRNPWGQKRSWSARSPESVLAELAQIEAPLVAFTDDLFTLDPDRVERICDLILARRIRKKFLVNARAEVARHPRLLRKMERAGFIMLMVGIESTVDETLRSMGKGFDTARLREYFKVLRNSSMFLHGYFILGNIGETVEQMLRISDFAHELGLDIIALSSLRVSRHSGLNELVENTPGYHVAPKGKVYSDNCSSKEIRQLRRRIVRQFYSAGQILRLTRKAIRNGAMRFLPGIIVRLPRAVMVLVRHARSHR